MTSGGREKRELVHVTGTGCCRHVLDKVLRERALDRRARFREFDTSGRILHLDYVRGSAHRQSLIERDFLWTCPVF